MCARAGVSAVGAGPVIFLPSCARGGGPGSCVRAPLAPGCRRGSCPPPLHGAAPRVTRRAWRACDAQVDEKGYHLPQSCPFAKEMDMYLDNELHKKEARFGNWRCLYCNKVFKSESYLERHIENRHPATIQVLFLSICGVALSSVAWMRRRGGARRLSPDGQNCSVRSPQRLEP